MADIKKATGIAPNVLAIGGLGSLDVFAARECCVLAADH
jgi:hypothetical protein